MDTATHGPVDVDPAQAAELVVQGAQLIDVREPYEHAAGHIAGATLLPMDQLAAAAGQLARDRPVVLYCRVGGRSRMAADALRPAGVDARSLRGGLLAWAREARPLEPADGEVADH